MRTLEHDITKRGWYNFYDVETCCSTFTAIVHVIGKIGKDFRGGPRPGETLYYVNGNLHREDGPAHVGTEHWEMYYLHGERMTFEQFWAKQRNTIHAPMIMAYVLGAKDE